jgi:hypothetical protein
LVVANLNSLSSPLSVRLSFLGFQSHPWWSGADVTGTDQGSVSVSGAQAISARWGGKRVILTETGFPSAGATRQNARPGVVAQSKFATDVEKASRSTGTAVYFFEPFDGVSYWSICIASFSCPPPLCTSSTLLTRQIANCSVCSNVCFLHYPSCYLPSQAWKIRWMGTTQDSIDLSFGISSCARNGLKGGGYLPPAGAI